MAARNRNRRFTDLEEQVIAEQYRNGGNTYSLAELWHSPTATIRQALLRQGVVLRRQGEHLRTDPETERRILELYLANGSTRKVAALTGVTRTTVIHVVKRLGGATRTYTNEYPFNEHAFDVLTDDVAYWAGFLMADGCCVHRKTTYEVRLALAEIDTACIEQFQHFLGTQKKIVRSKPKQGYGSKSGSVAVSITVASKHLFDRLHELGITERKSATATPHSSLAMNAHFWRGMMDGDGCVGSYPVRMNSKDRAMRLCETLSFCGSHNCVFAFREFCRTLIPAAGKILQRKNSPSVWTFGVQAKQAREMMAALYPEGCLALPRKYEIVCRILSRAYIDPYSGVRSIGP